MFGNDSTREIHDEAHRSQYGYDVLEIKRTWLYTTEYGKIGSFDLKGNISSITTSKTPAGFDAKHISPVFYPRLQRTQ